MFGDFFKLPANPFGVTPDPGYFYMSATHREALASLLYGLKCGRGFLGLIAMPGMGKTTMLYCLLEHLRNSARTALVFQTQTHPRHLLRHILIDLGIDPVVGDSVAMHQQLNDLLVREAEFGRQVVAIIDEAQNLDEETLESIRLLSNFENPRAKLIQIILAGQPLLADKLSRPQLIQLRQRLAIMAYLDPFSVSETEAYISHRLSAAGYRGPQLFDGEARHLIALMSRGIPRNINTLCFNGLSLGCARRMKRIGADIIYEVIQDLDISSHSSRWVVSSDADSVVRLEPEPSDGCDVTGTDDMAEPASGATSPQRGTDLGSSIERKPSEELDVMAARSMSKPMSAPLSPGEKIGTARWVVRKAIYGYFIFALVLMPNRLAKVWHDSAIHSATRSCTRFVRMSLPDSLSSLSNLSIVAPVAAIRRGHGGRKVKTYCQQLLTRFDGAAAWSKQRLAPEMASVERIVFRHRLGHSERARPASHASVSLRESK